MVGVLTVPSKGNKYSLIHRYSLTDSHSVYESSHIVWTNETGGSDVVVDTGIWWG